MAYQLEFKDVQLIESIWAPSARESMPCHATNYCNNDNNPKKFKSHNRNFRHRKFIQNRHHWNLWSKNIIRLVLVFCLRKHQIKNERSRESFCCVACDHDHVALFYYEIILHIINDRANQRWIIMKIDGTLSFYQYIYIRHYSPGADYFITYQCVWLIVLTCVCVWIKPSKRSTTLCAFFPSSVTIKQSGLWSSNAMQCN